MLHVLTCQLHACYWYWICICHYTVYVQHEAKMKSLSETVKDGDHRKRQLEEQIDQLNDECAKLSAQGRVIPCYFLTVNDSLNSRPFCY